MTMRGREVPAALRAPQPVITTALFAVVPRPPMA